MTSLLLPFLLAFAFALIASLIAGWARSPAVLGRIGEAKVERALHVALNADEYRVFSDLILPSLDGTTQIDHVVVSCFGVFVIETKNLRGLIVGHPRSAQWTQRRGRRSYPFQNPLRQNYRHVKAIESSLGVDARYIVPMIVFVGDCRLHPAIAESVTRISTLAPTILGHTRALLSATERDELCARLEAARSEGRPDARRSHLAGLRARHGRNDERR